MGRRGGGGGGLPILLLLLAPLTVSSLKSENLDFLGKIKNVVVVMEENRSFDHMLGWAKVKGITDLHDKGFFNRESTLNTKSEKVLPLPALMRGKTPV
jgi:Phosphoesterase family